MEVSLDNGFFGNKEEIHDWNVENELRERIIKRVKDWVDRYAIIDEDSSAYKDLIKAIKYDN